MWVPQNGWFINVHNGAGKLHRFVPYLSAMHPHLQALAWSFIFCFVVMTIWAMLMVEIIFPLIKDGEGVI